MKNLRVILLTLLGLPCFAQSYPEVEISNDLIKSKIYLPEKGNGYYQGTRFDWAGVVSSLSYKGHEYFGVWNPHFEPGLHDAITGPVEEFTIELGYDEARVGERFLKIGVGALEKPNEKAYSRFKTYKISDHGQNKVKTKKDHVKFSQKIKDVNGYGYVYKKELKLVEGSAKLVLSHSLKNTGKKRILSNVYNHNFFMIDNEPTNENIKTSFTFTPIAEGKGFGSTAMIEDRAIVYKRAIKKGENVFSNDVKGFNNTPKDYDITIENLKTGASVHITADRPIENMVYWACVTTSCPEPYLKIDIQPGETFHWDIEYEFNSKRP